jgi:phosphatidylglycerophosphate synthase
LTGRTLDDELKVLLAEHQRVSAEIFRNTEHGTQVLIPTSVVLLTGATAVATSIWVFTLIPVLLYVWAFRTTEIDRDTLKAKAYRAHLEREINRRVRARPAILLPESALGDGERLSPSKISAVLTVVIAAAAKVVSIWIVARYAGPGWATLYAAACLFFEILISYLAFFRARDSERFRRTALSPGPWRVSIPRHRTPDRAASFSVIAYSAAMGVIFTGAIVAGSSHFGEVPNDGTTEIADAVTSSTINVSQPTTEDASPLQLVITVTIDESVREDLPSLSDPTRQVTASGVVRSLVDKQEVPLRPITVTKDSPLRWTIPSCGLREFQIEIDYETRVMDHTTVTHVASSPTNREATDCKP